jgi:hypothetical protein
MFDAHRYIQAIISARVITYQQQNEHTKKRWWALEAPVLKGWLTDPDAAHMLTEPLHQLGRDAFDEKWQQISSITGTTHYDLVFLLPNDADSVQHTSLSTKREFLDILSGMSANNINAFIHWCSVFLLSRGCWYSFEKQQWFDGEVTGFIFDDLYDIIKAIALSGSNDAPALGDLVRSWLENDVPMSLKAACFDGEMDIYFGMVSG